MQDWINIPQLTTAILSYLPSIGAALLVFVALQMVYRLTHKPMGVVLRKAGLEKSLVSILVETVYKLFVIVLAVLMAASQLGIDVGAALAGIGIAGIAIGFAAQDVLSSIIAGFMIFFDKPFNVGDWIEIGDHYGEVTEITIRSTRIRTNQNTYVVIPNKIIVDEVIDNHSKHGATRIDVPVGIAYKEDIVKARETLLKALKDIDEIDHEKHKPDVVVEALGDSSVNLLVRVWIHDASRERAILYRTVEVAKQALDKAGIEIPFPHLQLFVDDVKDRVWKGMKKTS